MTLDSSNSSAKSGNTSQISPSKNWCFTVNNYSSQDIDMFVKSDSSIVPKFIFQEETGESGTPHLQGYLCFATKKRPKSVFKNDKIHWEKCRNVKASIEYCSKGDTRTGEVYTRKVELKFIQTIDKFYHWQEEIIDILKKKVDNRKLYWYWEPKGCAGKTTFQKYLFTHMDDVLIVSGKSADETCSC